MSLKSFEREMATELKEKVGKKVKWLEWSTSEKAVRKNLRECEEIVYLPRMSIWVAYVGKNFTL